jgi:glycosyltransferase involved in cell wall biosynthesis
MGGDILFEEQGSPTQIGKLMTLNLLETADFITSKSHHLTAVLERLGGFGNKTKRITWGIPVRKFSRVDPRPLRRALGIGDRTRVVLSPRILQRLYHVHDIVEAMPAVLSACGDVVLVITEYGADPGYKGDIEGRVATLGLSHQVRFVGAVPHDRMVEYYSLADVAVGIPSSDGLPQSLLEGMACSVANILRRLERYEEIVQHEESAYFVEGSIESVAAGVIRLLQDDELRERIQRNARAVVEREGDLDVESALVEERYYRLVAHCTRTTVDWRQPWRVLRSIRRFGGTPGADN